MNKHSSRKVNKTFVLVFVISKTIVHGMFLPEAFSWMFTKCFTSGKH